MKLDRDALQRILRAIPQPRQGQLRYLSEFCFFLANQLNADSYTGEEFVNMFVDVLHTLQWGETKSGERVQHALARQPEICYLMLWDNIEGALAYMPFEFANEARRRIMQLKPDTFRSR